MSVVALVAGYLAAFIAGGLVTFAIGAYCWWREQRTPTPPRIILPFQEPE